MTLKDLLKRKDKSRDNDKQSSGQSSPPVPEFTFMRTDTNTAEYITPPTFAGDTQNQTAADQQHHSRPHTLLGHRRASASSGGGERRLSSRLHLRSHSRNASSSSVNLPQDLPSISDGPGEKEDQEAEWEHRATLLARGNRGEGSQQVALGDSMTLEHNAGKRSRSISVSSSSGDVRSPPVPLHAYPECQNSGSNGGIIGEYPGGNTLTRSWW
jgi:hypothetical protein